LANDGAMPVKKLVVIGMGYVGIPAAALFADSPGFEVTGIQRRSPRSGWKIDLLNSGKSPFPESEPGIAELIRRVAVEKGTFRVEDDYDAIRDADFILIDVQTPVEEGDHAPRYESLREVATEVGRTMKSGVLVCIESTVAPGTTRGLVKPLLEQSSGRTVGEGFSLCFSYERVMVGRLLHNIRSYPRIVGGHTPPCAERGATLYRSIVAAPVVPTDCLTAEVAKTVENAYRDVNIAFANEVALACESLGVDAYEVRDLVNNLPNDPSNQSANPVRNMHLPGAGVGGHCLPKDSWLLKYGVDTYGKMPVAMKVILGSRAVNDAMPAHLCDLAVEGLKEEGVDLPNAKVVVLGYAFLENSDDTRNTPARPLIAHLRSHGIRHIVVHDPFVRTEEFPELETDVDRALSGADCACLVTRHGAYDRLEPDRLRKEMRHGVLVDGRNALGRFRGERGFRVKTVGKG
jgi:UDP-N-acetyl-D-mannosaminuronic acid dehydrogenase